MREIWFSVPYNTVYDDCAATCPDKVQDGYREGITEAVLRLPDCYSETGEAVPLILSAHGSGGRVCKEEGATGGLGYCDVAMEHGFAAFDIHGTRPDGRSYGNRRYVEAVYKAYLYILHHFNVQEKLLVAGASMGGLSAMNFVNLHPEDVRAVGLFYPRLNLRQELINGVMWQGPFEIIRPNYDFLLSDVISSEYGFDKPGVWQEEKTIGLNPWHNRSMEINGQRYTFVPCPIKIWHGSEDHTVEYPLSVEYIASVRRAGCYGELRTVEGGIHKHTPVMREELALWFERFR